MPVLHCQIRISNSRWLAMTLIGLNAVSRSRGAARPKFCWKPCPRNTEGAGKTGCALHPRSRVRLHKSKLHTSIQVQRKHSGLPRAMALRLIRVRPGDRLSCHHHLRKLSLPHDLTPAPGHQAHSTSPYAHATLVSRNISVHRSPPQRLRRWPTPLWWDRMAGVVHLICPTGQRKYFCAKVWTDFW